MGTAPKNHSHLRHVVRGDVPDVEDDVLALVADEARRGDVAVAAEGERLGPAHPVPGHVEVDGRLLLPGRAGARPRGRTCKVLQLELEVLQVGGGKAVLR